MKQAWVAGGGRGHTEQYSGESRLDNGIVTCIDNAKDVGKSWSFTLATVPIRLVFAKERTSNSFQFPIEFGIVPLHYSTLCIDLVCSQQTSHWAFAQIRCSYRQHLKCVTRGHKNQVLNHALGKRAVTCAPVELLGGHSQRRHLNHTNHAKNTRIWF